MFVRRSFNDLAVGDTFRLAPDGPDSMRTGNRVALNVAAKATFKVTLTTPVYVFEPDPTPEEMLARRIERFEYDLTHTIKTATATLEDWRAKLAEHPFYAFEWADRAFEAAAQVDVATRLLDFLHALVADPEKTSAEAFEMTLQAAREEVQRGARWPSRSTSPSSNHAEQQKLAAYATILASHDKKFEQ